MAQNHMANQSDNNDQSKPNTTQTVGSSGTHPEHEPLAFHFGNFSESLTQIEHHEAQSPAEALPSPLANQPYTPPILAPTSTQQHNVQTPAVPTITNNHPKLPLSDEEIEKNAHTKKSDDSLHWLALWCIRQLEIYEKATTQK